MILNGGDLISMGSKSHISAESREVQWMIMVMLTLVGSTCNILPVQISLSLSAESQAVFRISIRPCSLIATFFYPLTKLNINLTYL